MKKVLNVLLLAGSFIMLQGAEKGGCGGNKKDEKNEAIEKHKGKDLKNNEEASQEIADELYDDLKIDSDEHCLFKSVISSFGKESPKGADKSKKDLCEESKKECLKKKESKDEFKEKIKEFGDTEYVEDFKKITKEAKDALKDKTCDSNEEELDKIASEFNKKMKKFAKDKTQVIKKEDQNKEGKGAESNEKPGAAVKG